MHTESAVRDWKKTRQFMWCSHLQPISNPTAGGIAVRTIKPARWHIPYMTSMEENKMAELLIVLFVALIVIGWCLIWLHDNKSYWQSNWWSVLGLWAVAIGVFGTLFALGAIY